MTPEEQREFDVAVETMYQQSAEIESIKAKLAALEAKLADAHCLIESAHQIIDPAEYPELSRDLSASLDDALPHCLVSLQAKLAAVAALHSPFALYDECGHDHQEGEPGVIELEDVGLVCEAGRTGTVCAHCHTDDGMVREDCWDATFPCETRQITDHECAQAKDAGK